MFLIEVVYMQRSKLFKGLECAVLAMVLCTIKNLLGYSKRVGHIVPISCFLPSWYCHDCTESDVEQYSLMLYIGLIYYCEGTICEVTHDTAWLIFCGLPRWQLNCVFLYKILNHMYLICIFLVEERNQIWQIRRSEFTLRFLPRTFWSTNLSNFVLSPWLNKALVSGAAYVQPIIGHLRYILTYAT